MNIEKLMPILIGGGLGASRVLEKKISDGKNSKQRISKESAETQQKPKEKTANSEVEP